MPTAFLSWINSIHWAVSGPFRNLPEIRPLVFRESFDLMLSPDAWSLSGLYHPRNPESQPSVFAYGEGVIVIAAATGFVADLRGLQST